MSASKVTLSTLPPPEPPFLPLSPSSLHKLPSIPRSHGFPKLLATIASTLSTLRASASALATPPPSSPSPPRMPASKQSMLVALDQAARSTIDQARTVEAMRDVFSSVLGGAREAAREARRRRRQRRRRGGDVGVDAGGAKGEEGEEEYRVAGAVGDGVAGRYEVEFGRWLGEYEGLDLWTKYTKAPEYVAFRSILRPEEGGEGAGDRDGDGGDDAWFPENFEVCPLTLRPIEDRVSSKACGHAFEKAAARALLHGVVQARCPAVGCGAALSDDLLVGEGGVRM